MPDRTPRRSSGRRFQLLRGGSHTPLVLTCEHASNRVPPGLGVCREDRVLLATHRGLDLGAWEMARTFSRVLGATAVGGLYSRLVVDLNRAPGDPTLVMTEVDGRSVGFNRALPLRGVGRRVARYHVPYHSEIDKQVARHLFGGSRPLLLSVHSFTPVLDGRVRDFEVGVLYASYEALGRRLASKLGRRGFAVAINRPYSGRRGLIYAAARHGTNYGIPYLELEVNQALLRSPGSARRTALRIAPALAELIASPMPAPRFPRRRRA